MLGKLIKYDFKATGRLLVPTLIGLICLTLFGRIILNIEFPSQLEFIQALFITTYIILMIIAVVAFFIIIIINFYRNLLGDEGYLTFTLPVKSRTILTSKIIVGSLWSLVSLIVAIAAVLYMVSSKIVLGNVWSELSDGLRVMTEGLDVNLFYLSSMWILSMIVGLVCNLLQIYVSIAIGQVIMKNKIIGSIIGYIITNMVMQVISLIAGFGLMFFIGGMNDMEAYKFVMTEAPIYITLLNIIFCVIFYMGTNYIFKNKLNLE